MAVTKKSIQGEGKVEARADTSTPSSTEQDLQAEAERGYRQATGLEPEPTSYAYIGGMNAVVVVVDGTSYDFRHGDPVHFGHPVQGLDEHPDFERVEVGE